MFREIRKKDLLVSDEIGIEVLKTCPYGVLSVLGDDDYPYGVPLNFAYKDNYLYAHGALDGHKIDAVKKHPKVCFTVVGDEKVLKDEVTTDYTSVIVFGKAEIITPPASPARDEIFTAIMDKFVPNEKERTTEYIKKYESRTALIKISIEHMTCKQSHTK